MNCVVETLANMIERGEVSSADVWSIIEEIEANPDNFLLNTIPERRKRLKILRQELKDI